tara:strand:- start:1 stop:327 length:327 start_codon:yes stop_codon:yes gene_type:complete
MAITWSVGCLDSTKTIGSLSDVVTTVHWTASDSETVGEDTYTGSLYGSVGLADADSSSFTAYGSITESDAIAWAKAALGSDEVTRIEANITSQITEAKTPTTTSGVPW